MNKAEDQFTWWTYRANAWANNVGWRIDYQVITPNVVKELKVRQYIETKGFLIMPHWK